MRNVPQELLKLKQEMLKKNKKRRRKILYFPLPKNMPKKLGGKELIENFIISSLKSEVKSFPKANQVQTTVAGTGNEWYVFVRRAYTCRTDGIRCNYSQIEEAITLAPQYGIRVIKAYPKAWQSYSYSKYVYFCVDIPKQW